MLMLIISSFGPIHNCFFWFRVWLLQKAGQLADGKAAHKEHQQQAVRRQTAHRDHLRRQGAEDALLPLRQKQPEQPHRKRQVEQPSRISTVTAGWMLAASSKSFTFLFCLPQETSDTPSTSSAAQRAILPMASVEICRVPPLRSIFCKSILWSSI